MRSVTLAVALATLLAGCGGEEGPGAVGGAGDAAASGRALRAVLVINGTLGDRSFFDAAQRGMELAVAELGIEAETIELGNDPSTWASGLADVAAGDDAYDVLVTLTYAMAQALETVAARHADRRFISIDAAVDSKRCGCTNVHSILFRQNEGGYLAGLYAGLMTSVPIDGMNREQVVGAVGGVEIPVIADFLGGFEQGASSVEGVEVLRQYLGSFSDPARGKEVALGLFDHRADVVFHAAGGSGLGVAAAAAARGRWVIGVDSNQAAMLGRARATGAERMLTSVLKNVDRALVDALHAHLNGDLRYGGSRSLGLAEGGVGLADGQQFRALTPPEVMDRIEAANRNIVDGRIVVDAAPGVPAE